MEGHTLRNVGQLPNIHADIDGRAVGFVIAPDLSLDGIRSVLGRAIVVLKYPDENYTTQRGAERPISCGVINR
jgi:Cu-Zn family superoxide dismutase